MPQILIHTNTIHGYQINNKSITKQKVWLARLQHWRVVTRMTKPKCVICLHPAGLYAMEHNFLIHKKKCRYIQKDLSTLLYTWFITIHFVSLKVSSNLIVTISLFDWTVNTFFHQRIFEYLCRKPFNNWFSFSIQSTCKTLISYLNSYLLS